MKEGSALKSFTEPRPDVEREIKAMKIKLTVFTNADLRRLMQGARIIYRATR